MRQGFDPVPESVERLAKLVIDGSIRVHRALGPGLLESVYETCLEHELRKAGVRVETQVEMPVRYDGIEIAKAFRLDLLVEGELIVEIKAVEEVHPVHKVQLLTYLRMSGKRLGLLINFNVPLLKDGIHRVIL